MAEPVWRQLSGEELEPSDITEVDRDYIAGLLSIRNMDDDPKVFNSMELSFSTSSAKGHQVPLSTRYTHITPQNRNEYIRLALNYRLHEFDEQVKAVRDGMSKVIPVPFLSMFSASELQAMVCGSPDIPLGLLKSVATYKGFDPTTPIVQWFWEVMEEFTNQVILLLNSRFGLIHHDLYFVVFCRSVLYSCVLFGVEHVCHVPYQIFVVEISYYRSWTKIRPIISCRRVTLVSFS